jgi:molybdopterin converting factor subunit 1
MLRIQLFAQARQLAGQSIAEIPWTEGETVLTMKHQLAERYPALQPLMSKLLIAINNDYVGDDALLRMTDEVACFPPVSGG